MFSSPGGATYAVVAKPINDTVNYFTTDQFVIDSREKHHMILLSRFAHRSPERGWDVGTGVPFPMWESTENAY